MRKHLQVIGLYTLIAILATWPLLAKIGTHYPSAIPWFGGDPNIFTWWIDWTAKAILGQLPVPAGKMIFWPVGVDPLAGWDGAVMLLLGVPVRILTGNPVLAYNAVILAALIATAFSAYLLVLHLTRSRYASIFGGVLFGFSTYALVRATQHANLMMLFAVPLLALAAIRFGERPTRRGALWLGGAVFLAAISSWYYAITGVFFIAIAFLYFRKELLAKPKIVALACAAMLIAVLIPALPLLMSDTRGGQAESAEFIRGGGAHPANFIFPHPFTNVFGMMTKPIYAAFPPAYWGSPSAFEATSYLGILVLAALCIWAVRPKSLKVRYAGIWVATFVIFTVLALGIDQPVGDGRVPLPFAFLVKLFPFSQLRVPNRFFVWALLAGCVAASFAIAKFRSLAPSKLFKAVLTVFLAAVIAAEQLIFPYPLVSLSVPEFYREIARDKETYAIADLPFIYPGFSEYDYYQTVHGKPMAAGEFFYTAYSEQTFSFIKNNPLLAGSICRKTDPSPLRPFAPDKEAVFESLRANDIRYVIVHNLLLINTPVCAEPLRFIRAFFDGEKHVFADGEITVYRVPEAPAQASGSSPSLP